MTGENPFDPTRPLPERVAAIIEWHRESGDPDVTRLIEDLAAAQPVWRPIATAPRDGTRILLWSPDAGYQVGWTQNGFWFTTDGGWTRANGYTDEPTHWQPLPTGPSDV